jgi:hypothetical protein
MRRQDGLNDMTLAATAYENGQTAGTLFMVLLAAAVVHRLLVRQWLPGPKGVAAVSVVAIAVGAALVVSGSGTDPEKVRADMLAGCESTAGEGKSLCGCVVDEVMKRNGTSGAALDRLESEMRASQEEGSPVPAVFTESVGVCAREAGLAG